MQKIPILNEPRGVNVIIMAAARSKKPEIWISVKKQTDLHKVTCEYYLKYVKVMKLTLVIDNQ